MVNIVNIMGYLTVVLYSGFMYWFLHSHFFFIILVMLGVAPLMSTVALLVLRHFLTVSVSCASGGYGRCEEEMYFKISIKNTTFLMALDARLYITVSNEFYRTSGTNVIAVPIHAFSGYGLELPIAAGYPGIIRVNVDKICIRDMLGFYYVRLKQSVGADAVFLPSLMDDIGCDKAGLEQGMLESEESTKRGNDFSDVQEIREYIPGDRLMSIHWKLSAKRDILMVKDRVSMSDRQLVILPELCNADNAMLTMVLSATYTLICQMIEDKTTVRLMYFSMARYEYEDVRIDYADEADAAFARLFYEQPYEGVDEAASHMSSVHPEIKAYLYVTADDSGVTAQIRENI